MKKYLLLLMVVFAIALSSCGESHHTVKVGQDVYTKIDIPCSDNLKDMKQLHNYVFYGKNEKAMEMFYQGKADRIPKQKVTVVAVNDLYCKVKYYNVYGYSFEKWVYTDSLFDKGR